MRAGGAIRVTEADDRVRAANELATDAIAAAAFPLLSAVAAAIGAYVIGLNRGSWAHLIALLVGWLIGAVLVVRLRRSHGHPARTSSGRLLFAAAASFGIFLGLAFLLAPWQELMSMPGATPMMAIKDITANSAPFLASFGASWLVLRLARPATTPTECGRPHKRPHNNEMQQTSHG
jgi:peptidoglycan/LPS O-acetylase OafA/YrhL